VNVLLTEVKCEFWVRWWKKDATTPDYYPLSLNALVKRLQPKIKPRSLHDSDGRCRAAGSGKLEGEAAGGTVNSADSA